MAALDVLLAKAASSIVEPSRAQHEVLERLARLQERLDAGLLRVAVLGQFKRGKSTLLNALLGTPLLPTGVTPVTAIPTFIKAGSATTATVTFEDKAPLLLSAAADIPDALQGFISEMKNPQNRLKVASVELTAKSEFLDKGIMLVDTPGIGSTFLHNTRTAEAVLSECDAGVFVVSADPPITEAELGYLHKVQAVIPKIFFAFNKVDLLAQSEKSAALDFFSEVLRQEHGPSQPVRIFPLSARQGLEAKQVGNSQIFAESGIEPLEQTLSEELAREKRAITFATARQRAISIISDLTFQTELEHKALLLPEESLKHKGATFEASVEGFERERQAASDLLAIDRKRLLGELEEETDRLWKDAQKQAGQLVSKIAMRNFDLKAAKQQIAGTFSDFFEDAFRRLIDAFRVRLVGRLAAHQDRAGALTNLVRQTAAELMEIPGALPQSEEAFELKHEPYWVAPEPLPSLAGVSSSAIARLLPRSLRQRHESRQLLHDAERATLHNVANLDWAIRRNIDDAFWRFESTLAAQVSQALASTREAMHIASELRAKRVEEVEADVQESNCAVEQLRKILKELQNLSPDHLPVPSPSDALAD